MWSSLQFHVATTDPDVYCENIRQIVKEAHSVLRRNKERKAKENIEYINRKTREKHFEENQILFYSDLKQKQGED